MSKVKELQDQLNDLEHGVAVLQQEIAKLQSDQPHEGQWVWASDDDFLFYWEETSDLRGAYGYGFDRGVWRKDEYWARVDVITRPATDDEVEQALTEEAKRRGYEKGVEYKCAYDGSTQVLKLVTPLRYVGGVNMLTDGCGGAIFFEGDWAEIISEEESITINGHEAEFKDGYVQFGCEQVPHRTIKSLAGLSNVFNLSYYREGDDITPQIKQIAERIDQCT